MIKSQPTRVAVLALALCIVLLGAGLNLFGQCPPMTYPTGTSASDNEFTDKVRITWDPTPYAGHYTIWRAPYEYTGWKYTEIGSSNVTSFDDTTTVPGKLYKYKVQAVWPGCGTLTSGVDAGSRKLTAPTGVDASDAVHPDRIVVTWTAVAEADSYAVHRSDDPAGPFVEIGVSTSMSYEDMAAPCSGWYAVVAVAAGGASEMSAADEGSRIDDQPPLVVVPADITIECDESSDPSNTGYATATDNCDPSPSVTYSDLYGMYGGPCGSGFLERTWTATDSSGNTSQATQTICYLCADYTVTSYTSGWLNELPASVHITFTFAKCAVEATAAVGQWPSFILTDKTPITSDGFTENTLTTTIPAGAAEGTHYWWQVNAYTADDPVREMIFHPGGSFSVDVTLPSDPAVSSTTHTAGAWSNDPGVAIEVSGAADAVSGVDGFEVAWDQNASWTSTKTKTHEEDWSGETFTATSDGDWYFHLATVDNAGNWTGTIHLGPFKIDTTPPEFLGCPEDLVWHAGHNEITAIAYWDHPTVIDNLDPSPVVVATAVSGDTFPIGSTLVSYTATDAAGNAVSCSFDISVVEQVAPKGVVETMTEEFAGTAYDPGEIAILVNIASQAIADGAPAGTTSAVLSSLIEEGTPFDEFVERMQQFAELIEAGTPPGQAMNEVLGKGNSKK